MNRWKFITAGLVLVIIILCMMTFYLNGKHHNLEIQVNRMDREHEDLKKDYEKLYKAYYSYDKKVLKLLEGNPNVFWARDSSAYMMRLRDGYFFSFYKKPRMENKCFLWWIKWEHAENGSSYFSYTQSLRVDSLKPHQFQFIRGDFDEMHSIMVAKEDFDKNNPKAEDEILNILLKH